MFCLHIYTRLRNRFFGRSKIKCQGLRKINPQKMGIGEVITIFWNVNKPPRLQGLKEQLRMLIYFDEFLCVELY